MSQHQEQQDLAIPERVLHDTAFACARAILDDRLACPDQETYQAVGTALYGYVRRAIEAYRFQVRQEQQRLRGGK